MKAKQRALLVLLALAAALGAGLLALTRANARAEQAASAAQEGDIPLSSFAADSLTGIVYTYGGETLALDCREGVWTLADDPDYHISQSLCNTMAAALCALNAKRSLEPGPGQDYGLAEPEVEVTVTAAEQTETFRFGSVNGITGDIYLQKEGDPAVYTALASKAACFKYGKAALFEPFSPTGLTRSAVQQVRCEVARSGQTFTVELKAVSEAAGEADSAAYQTVWRLADDPEAELDDSAVDALLAALGTLVTGQITQPGPLENYGLDAPLVRVTATTEEGQTEVSYGIGTDGYYMKVEGSPSVYAVDAATVDALCQNEEALKK